MATSEMVERVYDFITEEEEVRTCEAIPESACTEVPGNFLLNMLNGTVTKLAEQLASPSLVLPWLMAAMGAPTVLSGLLVPIRQTGSLLPQLAIAGQIRRFPIRKWYWIGAGTTQATALFLILVSVLFLRPALAGGAALLLLAVFSIASGVGSVAYKDVLAKTIPKGRRGQLLAVRAAAGGGLALIAGWLLRTYITDASQVAPFLVLLGIAGALWLVGTAFFAAIKEEEGATQGGRNALQEAQAGFSLLKENPAFRLFVLARALFITVTLSVPFYSLHGRQIAGGGAGDLGVFLIATNLANILSSPLWGRLADRSSRTVMMVAGGMAALTGSLALSFALLPAAWQTPYLYSTVFLGIGLAQSGVRLARKTYLVDGAPDTQRPLYVAVSNTAIGVVTLAGSGFGVIAQFAGLPVTVALFAALAGLGVVVSWHLPEAEHLAG